MTTRGAHYDVTPCNRQHHTTVREVLDFADTKLNYVILPDTVVSVCTTTTTTAGAPIRGPSRRWFWREERGGGGQGRRSR